MMEFDEDSMIIVFKKLGLTVAKLTIMPVQALRCQLLLCISLYHALYAQ